MVARTCAGTHDCNRVDNGGLCGSSSLAHRAVFMVATWSLPLRLDGAELEDRVLRSDSVSDIAGPIYAETC